MLAAWYKKQMEHKAREEGREEGRALEREAWQEWRRKLEDWEGRKSDAESMGRLFDEPRPASPQGG